MRIENLANLPALLYGVLVRGPRVVAAAFLAWMSGAGALAWIVTLTIELAAAAGLVIAVARHGTLAIVALAIAAVVAMTIAWLRPVTPFYRIRFHDGEVFDYTGDPAHMAREVARFSPGDVAGYQRFIAASHR